MHADTEEHSGEKEERPPLMKAASHGFADIVALLLSHGANVNATSSNRTLYGRHFDDFLSHCYKAYYRVYSALPSEL